MKHSNVRFRQSLLNLSSNEITCPALVSNRIAWSARWRSAVFCARSYCRKGLCNYWKLKIQLSFKGKSRDFNNKEKKRQNIIYHFDPTLQQFLPLPFLLFFLLLKSGDLSLKRPCSPAIGLSSSMALLRTLLSGHLTGSSNFTVRYKVKDLPAMSVAFKIACNLYYIQWFRKENATVLHRDGLYIIALVDGNHLTLSLLTLLSTKYIII